MNSQKRTALLGALGGALLGAASMIVPGYLKPGVKLDTGVAIFITIGIAVMGAVLAVMNANEKLERRAGR